MTFVLIHVLNEEDWAGLASVLISVLDEKVWAGLATSRTRANRTGRSHRSGRYRSGYKKIIIAVPS